ncbi:hypothetical protein FRX31_008672 [Thalictrum thalictroides]|uniref:CLAVATA3/ESR (CLE)-related protein n=1 Tax=Thalictrum thalictroides TaxID=46969 RepID=A0A7J6WZ53_THATH|nr:hypothetical protein FRX31_008672 [Thalictrum thalictroides]
MICVINKSSRQMGHKSRRQEIVCLFLMILMLVLHLEECSCIGDNSASRFARLRGGYGSKNIPIKSRTRSGFGRRNGDQKDISDDVFDDDKRKIHTGPNPLHNK